MASYRKKSNIKIAIGLLLVVALIVGGIAAFMHFKDKLPTAGADSDYCDVTIMVATYDKTLGDGCVAVKEFKQKVKKGSLVDYSDIFTEYKVDTFDSNTGARYQPTVCSVALDISLKPLFDVRLDGFRNSAGVLHCPVDFPLHDFVMILNMLDCFSPVAVGSSSGVMTKVTKDSFVYLALDYVVAGSI